MILPLWLVVAGRDRTASEDVKLSGRMYSSTHPRVGDRGSAPRGGEPQGVEYRSRGRGADRLVVAVTPGNAGGTKGTGHPGSTEGLGFPL